jgi:excisionase family DNA binding protein
MTLPDRRVTTLEARLHNVTGVMERLQLSRSLIYELIAAEEVAPGTGLRSVKVGKRRLIPESALAEFIHRLEAGPAPICATQ